MDNRLQGFSKEEFNLLVTDAILECLKMSDKTSRHLVTLWFQVQDQKEELNNDKKLKKFCGFAERIFEVSGSFEEQVIKKIRENRRDLETIRRLKKYIEKMKT